MSSLGPRDCEEGAQSRDVVVNQRNIMNPVADMLPFAGSTGAAQLGHLSQLAQTCGCTVPWHCRAKILKNSRQWRVIEERKCRRKGEIRGLAQSRLTLAPNPARDTDSNIKTSPKMAERMHGLKVQGGSARQGRISMTLYGRTVLFCPSICVHFDCDRCDCAPLCSLICAARRI